MYTFILNEHIECTVYNNKTHLDKQNYMTKIRKMMGNRIWSKRQGPKENPCPQTEQSYGIMPPLQGSNTQKS